MAVAVAVLLWLMPVAACLSNPTPHPGGPDAHRYHDTVQSQADDDDPGKVGGGDALTETPTNNYDGADAIVGDVDPNASVGDAGGDGQAGDVEGEDDGVDPDYDNGGEVVPGLPSEDYSGSCGGEGPINEPGER